MFKFLKNDAPTLAQIQEMTPEEIEIESRRLAKKLLVRTAVSIALTTAAVVIVNRLTSGSDEAETSTETENPYLTD